VEHQIFFQLSVVMVITAGLALLARILRQPPVIAYIIAGFLAGPSLLGLIHDHAAFESFSEIGIALLLFIIGLGLNIGTIKSTGKPAILTFSLIVLGIGGVGMGLGYVFGFSLTESIIISIALLFSSTIIVVKSLSDKKETSRLYGRIAIGVLLVEDIAATLVLLGVSAAAGNSGGVGDIALLVAKGLGLTALLVLVGGYIMPRLSKLFASSQELLYVFAIAWAFGIASAFMKAGFSLEVGALFAGVALASLPYVQAIEIKLKPLRDFFLVLFFVALGESLRIDNFAAAIVPAIVFSVIILLAKPLLIMTSLGLLGYTKQTSFKAGVHLSQISEFSVIVVALAATSGLVDEQLITVITLIALLTIATSAYWMKYDDALYRMLQKPLGIFEKRETKRELKSLRRYPLVLLGYRHSGGAFVKTFRKIGKPFIVIDYNPDIIESLQHLKINHLYGDATDFELLDEIGIHHSELIVSTLNDTDTNCLLASYITEANNQATFICHAARLDDATKLYAAGATYVLMPHYIGDKHIDQFLREHGSDKRAFAKYRHDHLLNLGQTALQ
jgi:Kef-type K+ transport system membrane component KefB